MQGVVKVYDAATGIGVILGDGDTGEVMLRQGQRVVFDATEDNGTLVASNLRFGADGK